MGPCITIFVCVCAAVVLPVVSGQTPCIDAQITFNECTGGITSLNYAEVGSAGLKERCQHIDHILNCYKEYHKTCYSSSEITDYCAEKAVWKGICENVDVFLEGLQCMGQQHMLNIQSYCSRQMQIAQVLTSPMTDEAWRVSCELSMEAVACNYGYIAVSNCSIHFRELARKTNYASIHRECKERHYVCSSLVNRHCTEDDVLSGLGVMLQYSSVTILISFICVMLGYTVQNDIFSRLS